MLPSSFHFRRVSGDPARGGQSAAKLLSLLLAFGCAALAVAWGLRLAAGPRPVPADARLVGATAPDQAAQQAANLFGAEPVTATAAPAAGQFRLYGVIAGGDSGSALIGVDGQPPRAVAVGQPVAPGVTLRSTAFKAAWIERDGSREELRLDPAPPGAATPTPPAYGAPGPVFPPTIQPPAIGPQLGHPAP